MSNFIYIILIIIGIIASTLLYNFYIKKQPLVRYNMAFAPPTSIYPPIEQLQSKLLRFKRATPTFKCTNFIIPQPIKDLQLYPIYIKNPDGSLSTRRNTTNENLNDGIMTPVTNFKNVVSNLVREIVIAANPTDTKNVQDCLLNAIYKWAEADALTGTMLRGDETQGFVERMFFIIISSLSFLKVKSSYPNDNRTKVIQTWLQTMENSSWQNFKGRTSNLKSWAVLAHLLVSIVTGNDSMYNESVNEFEKQANLIQSDGSIKSELERKDRASAYITYYADPLITMQYILKFIGNQKYNQTEIHNLINLVLSMKRDPQYLVKQKLVVDPQITDIQTLQFLILYNAMFGSEFIKPENKTIFNQQIQLYQNNIQNNTLNRGNLASLFGV